MPARRFRKKPVIIQAIQWTFVGPMIPEFEGSWPAIKEFAGDKVTRKGLQIIIKTLEGDMKASLGDWIIKGIEGEFYPCKPNIFANTYESVDSFP